MEKLSKLCTFDRQKRRPQNCPFQSSYTQRTAQFTHGIPQVPQFTCRHHDGIISRHIRFQQSIQQMNITWYIPFQIPLLTAHFTLSFRITLWPMWLANSWRQPCFYPPQSHAQQDTKNWQKKTDKPDGEKPVLCQRTFSSVFRAVFFTQLNCTVKLYRLTALNCHTFGLWSCNNKTSSTFGSAFILWWFVFITLTVICCYQWKAWLEFHRKWWGN